MRIAARVQSLLRLRHVLVLVVLAALWAAVAPADAQTLLRTLDTPNPQEWSEFGYSLAVGDVNGDGQGDIAVGAPGETVGVIDAVGASVETVGGYEQAGRAYVYSFPAEPSGSHRRSHNSTATPTPVATSTPAPSATPISLVPPPTAAATARAEVGPALEPPSTGSGGESGASAKGSGWTVACYAVLASAVALVAGGWYVRRRRLR